MAIKVLVTCVGGGLIPQLVRFLKSSRVYKNTKVYGVDMNPNASGKHFVDYFQPVASGKSKTFTKQIIKICRKYKINLILPGSDDDALNLSKNRKVVETNITKIACMPFNIIKILSNKSKTFKYLEKFNIPTPVWYDAKNQKELFKCIKKLNLKKKDIVIKPVVSRGGRNVFIISKNNKKEIFKNRGRQIELNLKTMKKKYLKNNKFFFPAMVMEKLYPPCFDLDMLCLKGKLIKAVSRRRINSSVANDGHYVENRKDIIKIGEKIVKSLKLSWLYDCDFMLDKNKKPQIIEINPRMSGSVAVSVAAGVPIFDDLISIYKNKKIKSTKSVNKKIILPSVSLFKIKK